MCAKIQTKLHLYLASIILIMIACIQFYYAHNYALSAWKGGGFGMFSTVDSPEARFFRIYLMVDGIEAPVKMPNHLSQLAYKVRTIPTISNLELLAQRLVKSTWITDEGPLNKSTDAKPKFHLQQDDESAISAKTPLRVQSLCIELWRFHFDWYNCPQ